MSNDEREEKRATIVEKLGRHLADLGVALRAHLRIAFAWLLGRARRLFADARFRRRAAVLGRDLGIAVVLALLALGAGALCFERVEPGTIGVRQVDWGSEREIDAVDYPPGLYFGPRPFYSWHQLDARTLVLDFASDAEGGDRPPLELRSASGTTVQVSLSIPFRILPGEAHAIVQDGLKLAWPMRVKSTVEKVLVQELSKLDAEGFANAERRLAACAEALARLNGELRAHHVAAEGVFVRGFAYAPTYEKKKQEEQLAGQTLDTNNVLAELKSRRLENESLGQRLEQQRMARIAEGKRAIAAAEDVWKNQRIEDQKIEIQFLTHEIEKRKKEVVSRLAREFQEEKLTGRDRPLEGRQLANQALADDIAREEAERAAELQRGLAEVERSASAEVEAQRATNQLATAELARAEQSLAAELALAAESERIALEEEILTVQRDAQARAKDLSREADRAFANFVAEGQRAIAETEALRVHLESEALAHPGARMVLAREAAANLRLERVALDANDPRVPTVLDLDALVALLVGAD